MPTLSTSGYDLSEEEQRALKAGDVGAMYAMGIHPVIINGYCRAHGLPPGRLPGTAGEQEQRAEKEDEMADIVMAYGASHAPMMTADPESAPDAQAENFFGALDDSP